MKKLASVAVIPLFAGFLFAQADQTTQTTTTTTTTNWNGTLVDAGCRDTTQHREATTTSNPDANTTRTETTKTTTHSTECPVTTTTTSFGLLTPSGEYVKFDDPSNTRVIEVMKGNKKWTKYMSDKEPVRVHVVGKKKGDVIVIEKIQ